MMWLLNTFCATAQPHSSPPTKQPTVTHSKPSPPRLTRAAVLPLRYMAAVHPSPRRSPKHQLSATACPSPATTDRPAAPQFFAPRHSPHRAFPRSKPPSAVLRHARSLSLAGGGGLGCGGGKCGEMGDCEAAVAGRRVT